MTPEYRSGMSHDGIKLFGVRIIESRYVQKGTIFKIFKTDNKPMYGPQAVNGMTNFGTYVGEKVIEQCKNHNKSGMIPIPDFQTTVPESGSLNTDFGPIIEGDEAIHIPDDMQLPTVVDEKKKKKKKRRHSKTRKIELD